MIKSIVIVSDRENSEYQAVVRFENPLKDRLFHHTSKDTLYYLVERYVCDK